MARSPAPYLVGLLTSLFTMAASTIAAAEIGGKVTDYADGTLLNGVRVYLLDGKNVKGPVPTVDGVYKFEAVVVGNYTVRFDQTGYTPRPDEHSLLIQNAMDAKQVDAELMQEAASTAYYVRAGERFASLVKGDGGKEADYKRRWDQLRRIGLAPAVKLQVIRGIASKDDTAREQLPLDQYLKLEPQELEGIAVPFKKALGSDGKMPNKGFAVVGDEVVADIVLYELRKSKAEPNLKNKFVEDFGQEWKGSKAADIVKKSYKGDKMKVTDPK